MSGSVAGTIQLTAIFTDQNGNQIPYPALPYTQSSVIVPGLAPVIQGANIAGTATKSSFEIDVTGYSTPRVDTTVCFTFMSAAGAVLNNGNPPCLSGIDTYFSTVGSFSTGSQFLAKTVFSFSGDYSAFGKADIHLHNDLGDSEHRCIADFKMGTSTPGPCQ